MNYVEIYINELREAGYSEGEKAKQKFEIYFNEFLKDSHCKKAAQDNGLDLFILCAVLAQLKTGKYMGFSNPSIYNVKKFWRLSDKELDLVIANCPQELVGFALSADLNEEDLLRIDKLLKE